MSPVTQSNTLLVFGLDDLRYALRLPTVQRVIRIVEITPLPDGPNVVLGVINLHGQIVPVVDIRQRFHLPQREARLSDQLIIAQTTKRTVALVVDAVAGLAERSDNVVTFAEKIVPGLDYVEGVVKLEEGLVLIHDLDAFLSLDEEDALEQALEKAPEGRP